MNCVHVIYYRGVGGLGNEVVLRKAAGLTQKSVAESLRRDDGQKVRPPFLNDLEPDRRYPPEDEVIGQLAKILKLSSDVLSFYAKRVPPDIRRDATDSEVEAALAISSRIRRAAI